MLSKENKNPVKNGSNLSGRNEKITKAAIQNQLKDIGAKVSGNKPELLQRLQVWNEYDLSRTLFDVNVTPALDTNDFPSVDHKPLEKLQPQILKWLSPKSIDLYFSERMASKGYDDGRKLFMCNFLKDVKFAKMENNLYISALCSAQMKKSIDYVIRLHLNTNECAIVKSQCKCPAGVGPSAACKHVSAVLFGLEYYAVTGNVKQNESCTGKLQQWHKPKTPGRGLERTTVDEIMNVVEPPIVPSYNITAFVCDAFSKAKPVSPLFTKHCNLGAYLNDHKYCQKPLETIMLGRMNEVNQTERRLIERRTRNNKKLWHNTRKTRITASIAKNIVSTCRTKNLATSFLVNHIRGVQLRTKAIKWGLTHEHCALEDCCRLFQCNSDNFLKCGIIIDEERTYISATPDAIEKGRRLIVEIKCPFSVRDNRPEEVDYLKEGKLKRNHAYYVQVQIQMHVTRIHLCDFVVWTNKGIFVESIEYDAVIVAGYLKDLEFYYTNIFSRFYFKLINDPPIT
ncbi:hypothetical protein Bhyg_04249 [Pseudolycoriella hygida]|uniref:SWIM-type domain-containing protein n=1 Tax=Pseudolycoriella hygida TaxID=35572 RepID=A0A9Q0NFP9_9DIPT|nr:hypothetical protein Bhyg_04249 [Pseudolycoriella hygida]